MGNNPISTVADVVSDNRTYYNCPRCNRRVWAYGSFVGNVCNNCPGTVLSAIGNTTSMVTFGAAEPVAKVITEIAPKVMQVPTDVIALGIPEVRAQYKGKYVWSISNGSSGSLSSSYRSEKVIRASSRSIGIRSGIVDNNLVSHWWMVIETTSSYYNIQFRKSGSKIVLRRCDSEYDCDQTGLAEAQRCVISEPIHENSYSCSVSNRTLGDVVDWLDDGNFSSHYNLWNNNCQHLCKAIYQWI